MRTLISAFLLLFAFATVAEAQQYGPPPGQYQQQQRRHDANDVRDAALAGVVVGVVVDRLIGGGRQQPQQYRQQGYGRQQPMYQQPYQQGYGQPMYQQAQPCCGQGGGYYQQQVMQPPRVVGQHYEQRGGYNYLCTDYSNGHHQCDPC